VPVILTPPAEGDAWLAASIVDPLQQPLPDGALKIVAAATDMIAR
jgi:hypothetical protein